MIALDTNILIRYLTGDDKKQCAKVDALFGKHSGEGEIFISDAVLIELEWVLSSIYKFKAQAIAGAIARIIEVRQFCFANKEMLLRALSRYKASHKDFSDCIIGEHGKSMGAKTYTFDNGCKSDGNFIVI